MALTDSELSVLFYLCDAIKSAPHKYPQFRKIVEKDKSEKFMNYLKKFDQAKDILAERILVLKDIT